MDNSSSTDTPDQTEKTSASGVIQQETTQGESIQQNVVFFDPQPSIDVSVDIDRDDTYSMSAQVDAQLGEFLGRPLKIWDKEWTTADTAVNLESFDPWTLFFSSPTVKEKINHFALLRCDLRVKFVVNGNRFLYGSAQIAYAPRDSSSDLSSTSLAAMQLSQLPHVWLDPSTNQSGELQLPFISPGNWIYIPIATKFSSMGRLILSIFTPLKIATDTTGAGTVDISCYAWAENVQLCMPTTKVAMQGQKGMYGGIATGRTPMSSSSGDEYGVVSGPANVVSKAAEKLSDVPFIGPYALATKLVADGVGAVARLFGFSRPIILPDRESVMRAKIAGSLAYAAGNDMSRKLTFDPKQELTVDSRVTGLAGVDEMSFASFASRECYLYAFSWAQTAGPDTVLTYVPVTPTFYGKVNDGTYDHYVSTPSAHLAAFWGRWRCTMHFRFRIIASAFHRGRIKISYLPHDATTIAADKSNIAYSTIIDLEESRDVTFCVPWGQDVPFKELTPILIGSSPTHTYINGTLIISVINRLSAPATAAPIDVQVFASASDVVFREPSRNWRDKGPAKAVLQQGAWDPSVVSQHGAWDEQVSDTNRVVTSDHRALFPPHPEKDNADSVWYGDPIVSIRQMLKRFTYYRTTVTDMNQTANEIWEVYASREVFPYGPQFGDVIGDYNDNTYSGGAVGTVKNVYLSTYTPIAWFGSCFLQYRGSIRHKFVFEGSYHYAGGNVYVSRYPSGVPQLGQNLVANGATTDYGMATADIGVCPETWRGCEMTTTTQSNDVLEVEFPFYSEDRYGDPRKRPGTGQSLNYEVKLVGKADGGANRRLYMRDYVATGEDFNLSFFLYTPTLFDQPITSGG